MYTAHTVLEPDNGVYEVTTHENFYIGDVVSGQVRHGNVRYIGYRAQAYVPHAGVYRQHEITRDTLAEAVMDLEDMRRNPE